MKVRHIMGRFDEELFHVSIIVRSHTNTGCDERRDGVWTIQKSKLNKLERQQTGRSAETRILSGMKLLKRREVARNCTKKA